jgi:hypothetical protein
MLYLILFILLKLLKNKKGNRVKLLKSAKATFTSLFNSTFIL